MLDLTFARERALARGPESAQRIDAIVIEALPQFVLQPAGKTVLLDVQFQYQRLRLQRPCRLVAANRGLVYPSYGALFRRFLLRPHDSLEHPDVRVSQGAAS